MDIKDKKIAVIGSARSGLGAAKLAQKLGAVTTVFESKTMEQLKKEVVVEIQKLEARGIHFVLGITPDLGAYDIVITSPGVPLDLAFIQDAMNKGIEVIGEFEFASMYCKAPILAITGTNGKTTTTALVGRIIKAFNPKTYIVGNIGLAFSEEVLEIDEESIVVAEMSSFQLENVTKFHAKVSALLNLTPDHLNRHKTMDAYGSAKSNVWKNHTSDDFVILNNLDEYCRNAAKEIKANVILFDRLKEVERGAYVKEDVLYENIQGQTNAICKVSELKILGTHSIENALAGIAITRAFGVMPETIRGELIKYRGVEHRVEYVTTKKDVEFFNDSKATNTDAGEKALLAMQKPVRLIAGGMDKKGSFLPWVKLFEGRVQKVYVIGETKEQITRECQEVGYTSVASYATLEEATKAAYREANSGEVVLLSPACASWDMYESFEQRGDEFKEIVGRLEG